MIHKIDPNETLKQKLKVHKPREPEKIAAKKPIKHDKYTKKLKKSEKNSLVKQNA